MRIWLATVGEPLPEDGDNVRLLRTGQFAQWLADRGHEVTFWTGTMDHYGRKLRHAETHVSQLQANYRIIQLGGRLYKKSVSLSRFMNHVDVAKEFDRMAPELERPDIILASFPTVELCESIGRYCADNAVPFVIDVRDFWPDIFVEILPKPLRWLGPLVFSGFERRTANILAQADGVSGITQSALDWALRKAGRKQHALDFWHSFTYPAAVQANLQAEHTDTDEALVSGSETIKFCFFGTHSHRVNLEMFVRSFLEIERLGIPASLILCGRGAVTDDLIKLAAGSQAVKFPGWLNGEQIRSVLSNSDIGLLPYDLPDFHMSIPNKVAEYFSGGLPILSCTDGEVRGLIEREGCGFWCQPNESSIVETVRRMVDDRASIAAARVQATRVFAEMFEANAVFTRVVEKMSLIAAAHAN